MRQHIIIRTLFVFVILLVLSGCLGPVNTPNIETYTLEPIKPAKTTRQGGQTLLVSIPRAQAGYDSAKMMYSLHGFDLRAYAKHEWASPPARLLQPLLVQALANSKAYGTVVSAPFAGLTHYRLDTNIIYWVQRFDGGHNRIEIAVRARLVRSARGRVLGEKTFTVVVPVQALDPNAAVKATNLAVHKILTALVHFCARKG